MLAAQHATPLFVRKSETERLGELLDRVRDVGGAMVVRGEPGIGKSALLAGMTAVATARRMRILKTAGTESEVHLPFAGLQQLLGPILPDSEVLPEPQREGLVACCDSSPHQHASKHAAASGHPIASSLEPGQDWSWCYVDQVAFVV
jgi:hypothetical protein